MFRNNLIFLINVEFFLPEIKFALITLLTLITLLNQNLQKMPEASFARCFFRIFYLNSWSVLITIFIMENKLSKTAFVTLLIWSSLRKYFINVFQKFNKKIFWSKKPVWDWLLQYDFFLFLIIRNSKEGDVFHQVYER